MKNLINIIHTDPIKWQPSNLSVDFSAKTLTKPSVSSFVLALLLAANGNLPITYSTPYINKHKTMVYNDKSTNLILSFVLFSINLSLNTNVHLQSGVKV